MCFMLQLHAFTRILYLCGQFSVHSMHLCACAAFRHVTYDLGHIRLTAMLKHVIHDHLACEGSDIGLHNGPPALVSNF